MCNKIAIIIKLKLFLIVFTLNFSFFSFGQNEYVQGKWLVILDGHKEKSETIKSSEKYEFPTIILHSDNYENLNPSWYIVTIPFDDKDDAIEESKKLKNRGINCYVKYSGFLKSEKITLEESVKFIISGKYIVI